MFFFFSSFSLTQARQGSATHHSSCSHTQRKTGACHLSLPTGSDRAGAAGLRWLLVARDGVAPSILPPVGEKGTRAHCSYHSRASGRDRGLLPFACPWSSGSQCPWFQPFRPLRKNVPNSYAPSIPPPWSYLGLVPPALSIPVSVQGREPGARLSFHSCARGKNRCLVSLALSIPAPMEGWGRVTPAPSICVPMELFTWCPLLFSFLRLWRNSVQVPLPLAAPSSVPGGDLWKPERRSKP